LSTRRQSGWDVFLGYLAPAPGDRILDVGAGNGAKAVQVLQASGGAEVYAVDPNEKKVASMKRDFPLVRGSVAGAESLPFPDSHFDKVYSTMAVHHFNDLDKGFAEITRVLKQGGSFVILEVEPHSLPGRLFRFFGRLTREHMTIMDANQLLTRLGAAEGLKVVRSVGLGSRYLIQLTRT
jgi:ubiquinone/menaquinone biosynthesis C-methylase UbiE